VLKGEAEELARVDARSDDLIKERDTRRTLELINEHEADFGLPDDCTEAGETLTERRNALHTKMITLGQQHKQYFIDLAAALGYRITITEYAPFWAGAGVAGDPCGDQEVIFYWTVNVSYAADVIHFIAGASGAGDSLMKIVVLEPLECLLNKYKPGHTKVSFHYTGYAFGMGFDDSFDSTVSYEIGHLEGGYGNGFGFCFNRAHTGCFDTGGFGVGFQQPS